MQEVGPGVRDLKPGDHVVTSFLPACGRCRWCASGHQNLCDLGAMILWESQTDGTYRRRVKGHDVGMLAGVGSFSQYGTLSEASVVKIDDDLPLNRACLLGCGVTTGWGSAVNTADVSPATPSSSSGSAASAAARSRAPGWPARRRSSSSTRRGQARQGFPVRRDPFRDVDRRGHRAGRRADPRRDGRLGASDRRRGRGADDQRRAQHHPQGRRGGAHRHWRR